MSGTVSGGRPYRCLAQYPVSHVPLHGVGQCHRLRVTAGGGRLLETEGVVHPDHLLLGDGPFVEIRGDMVRRGADRFPNACGHEARVPKVPCMDALDYPRNRTVLAVSGADVPCCRSRAKSARRPGTATPGGSAAVEGGRRCGVHRTGVRRTLRSTCAVTTPSRATRAGRAAPVARPRPGSSGSAGNRASPPGPTAPDRAPAPGHHRARTATRRRTIPHTTAVDRALAQDRAPRRTRHGTARSPARISR